MSNRTLLVMRHAKSSWKEPEQRDRDRPLNQRGKRVAPQMAQFLEQNQLMPELVLCSTANRARSTLELMLTQWTGKPVVEWIESFYLAPPSIYLKQIPVFANDVQRVMVIGHNPGLESLVYHLTGQSEFLPTAAIAVIAVKRPWDRLGEEQCDLQMVYRPREMDLPIP